ncbi:MAG TPA: hypothetical protein VMD58_07805 [Acidobacteriaceae bacterium]|nr:hypothetical protein [Acidobacteriaceae bacterium]
MKFAETPRSKVQGPDVLNEEPPAHHSVYCPNCSSQLTGHRCKLICQGCGYYLSCADYY